MKIQYISDLHLEYPDNRQYITENPIQPKGDILILAGDIVNDVKREEIKGFFEKLESQFKFIISTMGNHEFHFGDISYAYPSYKKYLADNHVMLNNEVMVIQGIKFIVSILWSKIDLNYQEEIKEVFEDYDHIKKNNKKLTIDDTNNYHKISREFLETELKKDFDGKVIVITHYLPSYQCFISRWKDTPQRSAFPSELDNLILNSKVDYWFFGHQHQAFNGIIGNTTMLSNPLGDKKEKFENCDLGKFIEI